MSSSDHEDAIDNSHDEGDGATTPRAPQQYAASASLRQISNTTSGSEHSQVSLTSVELRRSNQQLRFEESNEDDDDLMQGWAIHTGRLRDNMCRHQIYLVSDCQ